jgi:hypothetical protein
VIDQRHCRAGAIAAFLILVSAPPLAAQILPGLGVKAGVTLATQKTGGEDGGDDDLKAMPALTAGVFMTFPVASWLEFQPEVLYSVKGAKVDETAFTAKALVDYLEVPLLARVSRRGAGRTGFYVAGGPYVALRLRARTRTDFGSATEELDITDTVERLDFGFSAGGGVEWKSLVFDGRYSHGLKDIDADRSDARTLTNRAITVTAGFRF